MTKAKRLSQFFTPPNVAASLVSWVLRSPRDQLLDPACGNGEFLACALHVAGIELDGEHARAARSRVPNADVHVGDFFAWAQKTRKKFDAVVGNPPFIRYHGFQGEIRERALRVAQRIGAELPGLTSSWAPFIAGAASVLKRGGRLAFVVPAEIGHAVYAGPLVKALTQNFQRIRLIAIREKLFPELSEDTWLLYAEGFGQLAKDIELSEMDAFVPSGHLPKITKTIPLRTLEESNYRLRRFLLPDRVLREYAALAHGGETFRLGEVADVGIGYVTGDNDFFHIRPSQAHLYRIPKSFLRVAVRRGEYLPPARLVRPRIKTWLRADSPVLLLDLDKKKSLPSCVESYLSTPEAEAAKESYKCRAREPWYAVPDVRIPDGFLNYMSGDRVALVRNDARCVNSVHVIHVRNGLSFSALSKGWSDLLTTLSCEVEGHPLGGGLLKLEPREAQKVLISKSGIDAEGLRTVLEEGITVMRKWRHCGDSR